MREEIMASGRASGPAGQTAEGLIGELPKQVPRATFCRHLAIEASPNIDHGRAKRCIEIQGLASPLDQRFPFLLNFTWASSSLAGSTYSELDTEALITYGEHARGKPAEDAFLALNHLRAGKHLWSHRELSVENLCRMNALLTDDPGRRELTPHARQVLENIIATAATLPPIEAAVYLLTRVAYVQSFSNGNKRTSRLAANIPLLAAGLIPFSFADVKKGSYIRGMAAFYELGDIHVIEQTFIEGYVRSVIRSSHLPAQLRLPNVDPDNLADDLVTFINTGKPSPLVQPFLKP